MRKATASWCGPKRVLTPLLALTACVAIAVSGCSSQAEPSQTQDTSAASTQQSTGNEANDSPLATEGEEAGDIQPVDSLTLSGPNAPLTLDAAKAAEIASILSIYLGQGQLFRFDENQVPQPDLAESAELSEDGLSMTITLRDGVVYSDGSPVVADDIVASFDHAKEGTVASYLATMDSMQAVDNRTVKISLNTTDPDVLTWLTGRVLPINPADKIADPDYFNAPVSAGPYIVDGWTPGDSRLRLIENESYWAGPMMAKQVEILGVPDVASRVLQVTSGDIDFAWDVPVVAASNFPDTVRTEATTIGGYIYLALNTADGNAFEDPRIRQAVSLALDRKAISDRAFQGEAPPLTSFLYSCTSLCEPGLLPNAGGQDVAEAKQLMSDAGAPAIEAELQVSNSRPGWKDAAVVIAEQLNEIGISLTVTPVDEATWIDALGTSHNFTAILAGGAAPPQSAIQQIFADDGWWALGVGYTNDQTTKLVAEAGSTQDTEARKALFSEIQTIGKDTMPVVPILERIEIIAQSAPEGMLMRPLNSQLVNVQTVAQAKAGLNAGQYAN